MADVHKLPDLNRAEREASEWLARLNADDVSEDDRRRFTEWRAVHPAHGRAYDDLVATYREFEAAGPFIRAITFAQSINESATRPNLPRVRMLVVASSAAILAFIVFTLINRSQSTPTYRTAIGEHSTISLPDGSTLELNSASSARVEYGQAARIIYLDRGEGFFEVTKDVRRPFWVVAPGSWVRAVGTAFNVYVRANAVEVTVSEGAVKVGSSDSRINPASESSDTVRNRAAFVTAGHQVSLQGAVTTTRGLSTDELAHAVGWREGILYFENRPVQEVVDELARYSTVKIVIDDERVRRTLIGGTFQASPLGTEAFLITLKQALGLQVRRDGSSVHIESAAAARVP